MDQNIQTLGQDLETVVETLPLAVREIFSRKLIPPITKKIVENNNLRLDQGAVLEKSIVLLLTGLQSPEEVAAMLQQEANLNEENLNNIFSDLNDFLFMPLQKKMREGGSEQQRPQMPEQKLYTPPQTERIPPRPPQMNPVRVPGSLGSTSPVQPRPPQPSAHTVAPPPNLPGAMPEDHLLPDHETAHINVSPGAASQPASPEPSAPPAPQYYPPVQPAPQQRPQSQGIRPPYNNGPSIEDLTRPPEPQSTREQKPRQSYGVDPYREPVDENSGQ